MSITTQIVCDGCGKSVSCGSGRDRRHAHQVRAALVQEGWSVSGAPDGDLCRGCRPPRMKVWAGATKPEVFNSPDGGDRG